MRGYIKRQIQHDVKLSAVFASRQPLGAVFFVHKSLGGALSASLHFLVVLLGAISLST